MISFELVNGQPYGSHVPISIDDHHYIEYPLDSSTDFPLDFQDEERMLMEAIMESLKDVQLPQQPEESTPSADTKTSEHSQENHKPDVTADKDRCESSKTDSTFGASQSSIPNTSASSSSSESPNKGKSSRDPCRENESTANKHDPPDKSSGLDPDDGTKATLTVVKNSLGNIMDGLFRRRDWNIFKSTK